MPVKLVLNVKDLQGLLLNKNGEQSPYSHGIILVLLRSHDLTNIISAMPIKLVPGVKASFV